MIPLDDLLLITHAIAVEEGEREVGEEEEERSSCRGKVEGRRETD